MLTAKRPLLEVQLLMVVSLKRPPLLPPIRRLDHAQRTQLPKLRTMRLRS